MVFRLLFARLLLVVAAIVPGILRGQQADGGATVINDGGGETILQSIGVPPAPGAPFSMTLAAEWARSMTNGGTYTIVNSRPIKRDSRGRIYQERVLMVPKGSRMPLVTNWIQIEDPVAHTFLQCNALKKTCEMFGLVTGPPRRFQPSTFQSGPIADGKAYRQHENLGADDVLGVPVQRYRDTTTVQPGVMGNDKPMSTLREFSYSQTLGLNLRSVVDAPSIGRQTFTVTQIDLTDPEPKWFAPPEGYTVRDLRDVEAPAHD